MKSVLSKKGSFYLLASFLASLIFWFGFVSPQRVSLEQKNVRLKELEKKAAALKTSIVKAQGSEAQFRASERVVNTYEQLMPPEEISLWIVHQIKLVESLRLELVNDAYDERHVESLYYWPYNSVFFSFKGVATYNEITAFVTELEQKMPFMKITSLQTEQFDNNRYSFRVNIYSLVNSHDDTIGVGNLPMRQARATF